MGTPSTFEQSNIVHPGRQWQLPSNRQSPCSHGEHRVAQSKPVYPFEFCQKNVSIVWSNSLGIWEMQYLPLSHLHDPSDRQVPWVSSHGRHSVKVGVLHVVPIHPSWQVQDPSVVLR